MKKQSLTIEQFSSYFLLFCVIGTLMLLFKVLEPFIIDLILAAIMATVFQPIHRRIRKWTGERNSLAAFLTSLFIVFVILIPLSLFIYQFIIEAIEASQKIYTQIKNGALDPILKPNGPNGFLTTITERFPSFMQIKNLDLSNLDLEAKIADEVALIASKLGSWVTEFATRIASFAFHFGIMIISMFFFLKDSNIIMNNILHLSPLPTKHNELVMQKFKEISQAILLGIFVTAAIQGALGGIGFAIAGLPSPVFWGTIMAFFALIPFLGTVVVWLPAALYQIFISGNIIPGVFLLIWGATVVGTIDNFLRPYFIHGRSKTYPLLIFLAILGGLSAFNLIGIIIGPLVLTITFVFINIYEFEYHGILHSKDQEPKTTPKKKTLLNKLMKRIVPKKK